MQLFSRIWRACCSEAPPNAFASELVIGFQPQCICFVSDLLSLIVQSFLNLFFPWGRSLSWELWVTRLPISIPLSFCKITSSKLGHECIRIWVESRAVTVEVFIVVKCHQKDPLVMFLLQSSLVGREEGSLASMFKLPASYPHRIFCWVRRGELPRTGQK